VDRMIFWKARNDTMHMTMFFSSSAYLTVCYEFGISVPVSVVPLRQQDTCTTIHNLSLQMPEYTGIQPLT
jgi:hypothetical protein